MKYPRSSSRVLLLVFALTACGASPDQMPPILLFTGRGTSANDVAAVETVLKHRHLDYWTANSRQLNAMNEAQLMKYRLLIIPGGDFIAMSNALGPNATKNIHNAVQHGLNYLGLCGGAFLAGTASYNSLHLATVQFGFYSAERRGIRKAIVAISSIDGKPVEHYWEDGPQLSGWGDVVGRYPDGTPAIVQGTVGKGWVMLTGVHPEAPQKWWRGLSFRTSASAANTYAGTIIDAALHRTSLPHY
jgi:glutamine amidotransferase-like uncharacterized protein